MIQAGDIILVSGEGIMSHLIEWATSSKYSHVLIALNDTYGIESQFGRNIGTVRLDKYINTGYVYRVNLTPAQTEKILEAAKSLIGQPYGIDSVANDFLRFVLHFPPIHFANHWKDCSQYVNWCFSQGGEILTKAPFPAPVDIEYSPHPNYIGALKEVIP